MPSTLVPLPEAAKLLKLPDGAKIVDVRIKRGELIVVYDPPPALPRKPEPAR